MQENVQSVLASQEQVEMLMTQIEVALSEVEVVESRLNMYEEVISHVRDALEKMEEKNSLINVVNGNNQKLLAELENVIVSMGFTCVIFMHVLPLIMHMLPLMCVSWLMYPILHCPFTVSAGTGW